LQLEEIISILNINSDELIDKASPLFLEEYAEGKLDKKGILKTLRVHSEMIKTPIAILNDSAHFIDTSFDLINEDMISNN
jgi:arsenate reductase-like glutaredoxin family protein